MRQHDGRALSNEAANYHELLTQALERSRARILPDRVRFHAVRATVAGAASSTSGAVYFGRSNGL